MDRDIAGQVRDVWDTYHANFSDVESVSAGGFPPDELDTARRERIPILLETLSDFVDGNLALGEFKSEIDGQNKRHRLWGFKGMNGMMFFNMLYNSSGEAREQELAELLRTVLQEPQDDSEIEAQIRTLEQYVEELRADVDNLRSAPRLGSIPYFLSYFWQLQNPDTHPIYYTSMRRALSDLAIWEPTEDLAETYLQFRALNERMRDILTEYTGEDIHLWDIEHAFYYWQHREEAEVEATTEPEPTSEPESETVAVAEPAETLPSSYIPPIVSILPD
ncbi:hypothetical protein, partial [Halalkalicoccus subterraneus]|uniref:hypothetical protein n=1 Tax=Halalkalicoccus subterraneus TaxID=2675002 RepID=UPI001B8762EC